VSEPTAAELIAWSAEPGPRRGEPVRFGLPWPPGVPDGDRFHIVGPDGATHPVTTRVLERWPDGTVRWCLFDANLDSDGNGVTGYRVEARPDPRPEPEPPVPTPIPPEFWVKILGHRVEPHSPPVLVDEPIPQTGEPFRYSFSLGIELAVEVRPLPGTLTTKVTLTLTNTLPADHPGGNWDLGAGGSEILEAVDVFVPVPKAAASSGTLSLQRGEPGRAVSLGAVFQASSGGENWDSTNHLDADRRVAVAARGYWAQLDDEAREGLRSTPVATREAGGEFRGVAVPDFWENFPKALRANAEGITLSLFPLEARPHELQGGEQKTHVFFVAHGRDAVTAEPMLWCRSPLQVGATPEWYAASRALPFLTPAAADPNRLAVELADLGFVGADTFATKREAIDEYGWRHFGDLYGDHEATTHTGPRPLISHYNNQYDCVLAFLTQFFRTGEFDRLAAGMACADHTVDIDIYHTDGDKWAYNHGLFWHTYHYADADTGTHRSYPKSLTSGPVESLTEKMDELGETAAQLKKAYAVGGGPSASHNYNAGLMLAYYLTGEPRYRDAAVGLADFVIRMDDPRGTVLKWLSRTPTGLATESGAGGYHGPGRAAGNSILALLVGHRLTGEARYLAKCEEIIRRVVHPRQDLDKLDLLNAELRWFYTMTLQALGEYLAYKADLGQLDEMYDYAAATLLRYANWMAANERPTLDTPEKLQYPNETWAAQDLRKADVFRMAARLAGSGDRERFRERADWFFTKSLETLNGFATKSLCRPVILVMRYGWPHAGWQRDLSPLPSPTVAATAGDFGTWEMFVPQKVIAVRRAKRLVVAGVAIVALSAVVVVAVLLVR
jgi:hypothetical protein